jgi:general secretion pathway protein F
MQFVVRALDTQQQVQTLILEGADEADVRQMAAAKRLTPLQVQRRRSLRASSGNRFDLLLFAQELHSLLKAGLSVVETLEALLEKEATSSATRRALLSRLLHSLREGHRLSAALGQQPAVFPPLFVGIIQAAEGTSDLPRALARYVEYETRLRAVRHKVVSAAIYPSILLLVGGGVTLFLLAYVVPRFASVYQGSSRSLPIASQVLIDWGAFIGSHATTLTALAIAGLCALAWLFRPGAAREQLLRLLRVVPGASAKLQILELSRLYLTLGMLLEGGIALTSALRLSGPVLSSANAAALQAVLADIQSGQPFSSSLERHGLSTPVAMRLVRVGEKSGELGTMLTRTAAFYDEETGRWIERFTKSFEPLLMAAIGIVVGLVVILLYMPIFDLAGSLGG